MFEIDDSWTCKSFGVNWVCHHYLNEKSRPAFIFTTARLSSSATKTLDFNEFELSETALRPAKKVSINNHIWIDSFHQNSFYKNVLSRYERTLCCEDFPEKFQILVGFHSFKKNYPRYTSIFMKAIMSLNLLTSNLEEIKSLLKRQNTDKQDMNSYVQSILFEKDFESVPEKNSDKKVFLFMLCALLFVFLFFVRILFKRKRKRKKSSKRKN